MAAGRAGGSAGVAPASPPARASRGSAAGVAVRFTNPDLDTDRLVADPDKVAAKMLPLLPLHLADPGPKPLDLAKKLSSSLGKIAPSHWTYIILPEEEVSLGAAATELALAWLWQNTPQEGHPAKLSKLGTLAKALSECEPSFGFDEDTLASFLKSLGAKAHQEMVQWLEKIGIKSRGKRPLAMTLGALVCPSWLCSKGRAEGIAMAIRAHLKELIEAPEHHSTDKGTWRF